MANSNNYTLSMYDEKLSNKAKEGIRSAKADFAKAQANGDSVGMAKANAQANRIRKQYGGYTGGSDGSGYYPVQMPSDSRRPDYKSSYGNDIDGTQKDILARGEFSYDLESDPMYQLYKKVYTKAGNDAYDRAFAQGAIQTGGIANTNAVSAAVQAQSYYNSLLADKATDLYDNAYNKYMDAIKRDYDKLEMLSNADATDYMRYRDEVSGYEADRDFDYNQYRDDYNDISEEIQSITDMAYQKQRDEAADDMWQQEFDYTKQRDTAEDSMWQQEFDYTKQRDTVEDSQWQQELDYTKQHDSQVASQEAAKLAAQIQNWQTQNEIDRYNTLAKLIQSVYNKSNIGVNVQTIKDLMGL